jgi:Arc/MetJ-type ribon-helix-helix transcriptional regulator
LYYEAAPMTVSLRLEESLEAELRQRLARDGIPLSDFIRQAIQEKLEREVQPADPYTLGRALFGRHASGEPGRSQRRKQLIRERLHARHRGG